MPVFRAYNTQKTLLQKSRFMQGLDALVGVILFCKLRRKKIEKPPETYCSRWFWYVEKRSFIPFSKTLKGLGNEGVNTFASQMPAINGCPHLLRCGVPRMESQGEKPKFQGF